MDNDFREYIFKFIERHSLVDFSNKSILSMREFRNWWDLSKIIMGVFGLSYQESNAILTKWINLKIKGPYMVKDYSGNFRYYIGLSEVRSWMEAQKRWKMIIRGR